MKIFQTSQDDYDRNYSKYQEIGSLIEVSPSFCKSASYGDFIKPSNSYFSVNQSFIAHVFHSTQKKSNVYYGSSNLLGPIYKVIEIPIGSEIHNLHGGIFVVLPDNSVFRISRPTINKNSLEEISNHKKVSYNID